MNSASNVELASLCTEAYELNTFLTWEFQDPKWSYVSTIFLAMQGIVPCFLTDCFLCELLSVKKLKVVAQTYAQIKFDMFLKDLIPIPRRSKRKKTISRCWFPNVSGETTRRTTWRHSPNETLIQLQKPFCRERWCFFCWSNPVQDGSISPLNRSLAIFSPKLHIRVIWFRIFDTFIQRMWTKANLSPLQVRSGVVIWHLKKMVMWSWYMHCGVDSACNACEGLGWSEWRQQVIKPGMGSLAFYSVWCRQTENLELQNSTWYPGLAM